MKFATLLAGLSTALALGSLSVNSALAQKPLSVDDVHATLVTGKRRAMIAYTGKDHTGNDHSFTFEVNPKTAKPSDIPGFVRVEGQIVQATLVPSQPPVDQRTLTSSREREVLTGYMNYELGYYRKKLRQKYTGLVSEWVTINRHLFLVWYFDMPKDYKLVSRQLYFSTLFYDQVLDLNAPVFRAEQFSRAHGMLTKLAGTLKTYDKSLNLDALGKQLNK